METNKNTILDNVLGVLGILSLVVVAYHAYKSITAKTETTVISDKGLRTIADPNQAKKMRDIVDEYHETGDWDKTELESIL